MFSQGGAVLGAVGGRSLGAVCEPGALVCGWVGGRIGSWVGVSLGALADDWIWGADDETDPNVLESRKYKEPVSGSGKEKADDVPSWAKGNRPYRGEDGRRKGLCKKTAHGAIWGRKLRKGSCFRVQ